jgi:endonuclease YncB( thermonuclease family)
MKSRILNLICLKTVLLSIYLFFEIAISKPVIAENANYFRVKSHLVFNKKISGKAQVIDGDSIKVNRREIRLFGLDAPEYKQKCFDNQNIEYNCGIVSKEFLAKLIHGKKVECIYAEKDKYDRLLSKCFIDSKSINEEIIKNGMAVIYNFTESSSKMDSLEEGAKSSKIGIWQGSFELPKDYRKHNPRI